MAQENLTCTERFLPSRKMHSERKPLHTEGKEEERSWLSFGSQDNRNSRFFGETHSAEDESRSGRWAEHNFAAFYAAEAERRRKPVVGRTAETTNTVSFDTRKNLTVRRAQVGAPRVKAKSKTTRAKTSDGKEYDKPLPKARTHAEQARSGFLQRQMKKHQREMTAKDKELKMQAKLKKKADADADVAEKKLKNANAEKAKMELQHEKAQLQLELESESQHAEILKLRKLLKSQRATNDKLQAELESQREVQVELDDQRAAEAELQSKMKRKAKACKEAHCKIAELEKELVDQRKLNKQTQRKAHEAETQRASKEKGQSAMSASFAMPKMEEKRNRRKAHEAETQRASKEKGRGRQARSAEEKARRTMEEPAQDDDGNWYDKSRMRHGDTLPNGDTYYSSDDY